MSAPILSVNVSREQWAEVRRLFTNLVPGENSRSLTEALIGPIPAPPAPEYRVDRSDGYGARVSCLAGDRVSIEFTGSEMRSADAIELGEAIVAAGRYLQEKT